jgi:hypothetical protein
MGSNRTLSQAHSQALKLEAAKVAAGTSMRLWNVRAGALCNHGHQGPSTAGLGDPYPDSVGALAIIGENANSDALRRTMWEVSWDLRNE